MDSNANLEFELELIQTYEQYDKKLELYKLGRLKKTDIAFPIVEKLFNELPDLLKRKEYILSRSKLMRQINKNINDKPIKHKTIMKNYK